MKRKIDSEERALITSYRRSEFKPVRNQKAVRAEAESAARRHLKKNARISIRLSSTTLAQLKRRAAEEGLGYQTLISSVLHKYVSGRPAE